MASIRRTLFPSSSSSALCCSSDSMVVTIAKDSIRHESEPTADYTDVVIQEKTHGTKKILVVCKSLASEIHTQLADMPLLHDIPVVLCLLENLSSVCSREKFALVFVDRKFEENFIVEICSILRFNFSSPNKAVAIIGVDTDQDVQISSSPPNCGFTEVISFPLKEDIITQLLLKYAGIVPFKDLPLTPESPDDAVAVARKAEEIIRESEEQCSFLGDKADASFNGHTAPIYYTNSSTNPYTRTTTSTPMIQAANISRQSSPFVNQELRRSSMDSNSCDISRELNESYHDKQHSSWTIANDQISQNLPQSILPMPRSNTNQCASQTIPEQFGNSCQHSRQPIPVPLLPAPLPQPTLHVLSPVPTMVPLASESTTLHEMEVPTASGESPEKAGPDLSALSSVIKEEPQVRNSSYMVSGEPGTKDMKITMLPEDLSKHSSKERIRRERIKDSCDKLRYLLPNISGKKTDMASILEMTVKFVKLVKERVPPTLMDEIGDCLCVSTMGMVRKRAQKDLHLPKPKTIRNYTKKHTGILRPRTMAPVPVSVQSAPLTPGDINHIIYSTFTNNNRPLYHQHGQHCSGGSLQHSQYLQGMGYNTTCNSTRKDMHHSYIHGPGMNQTIPKDIPALHMHKEPSMYHHNYQPMHTNDVAMCPHRKVYGSAMAINGPPLPISGPQLAMNGPQMSINGPPSLSINTSNQWNYMKLPSISPCSSVCLSTEDPDTISGSSNTSFDSPLWDETSSK